MNASQNSSFVGPSSETAANESYVTMQSGGQDPDTNIKNRFSDSRIEAMSHNFGKINAASLIPTREASGSELSGQAPGHPKNTGQPRAPSQPLNIETLLKSYDKDFSEIPDESKQKVVFALNNCSNTNLASKADEIKKALAASLIIRWFAKHIVYQRAPQEPNFHTMYINLVDKLEKPEIFKLMIRDTYQLINIIIDSDRNPTHPERSYIQGNGKVFLKNLGSWLGQITLARNRPIMMKDLDVKMLVVEGFENQKLEYIIPLVCKILLNGSSPGSVFKPKNAWMNAVLSVLVEISTMSEIKMALKCEVQVLLNGLKIPETEIVPSKIIQIRAQKKRAHAAAAASSNLKVSKAAASDLTINDLPQYVIIDQKLLESGTVPEIKTLVAQALDKAIK